VYEGASGYRPAPRVRDRAIDGAVCTLDMRLWRPPSPPVSPCKGRGGEAHVLSKPAKRAQAR